MMSQPVPAVPAPEVPADAVLLDVREDNEWFAGHAPHAVHVPMGEVPARLGDLPAGGTLHVVCRSGGRSAQVTAYLAQAGWDAVNVDGGMHAWAACGRPMVAESGGQPQVV